MIRSAGTTDRGAIRSEHGSALPGSTMPVKLVVAYDGGAFHGFAENAGVVTVAGELRRAIELVTRADIELVAAGRTDAGVHGWGQVVSCRLPSTTDLDGLVNRVNKLLAPAIAVRDAEVVHDDFNARFSAVWRHYRYEIWNAPTPHPLLAGHSWWVRRPLDLEAMQRAADALVGEHDFSSFCRRPKQRPGDAERSLVREILMVRWSRPGGDAVWRATGHTADAAGADAAGDTERAAVDDTVDDGAAHLLRFEIRATAFCHQMVRSIVGTLVDVGSGALAADAIPTILACRERAAAGQVAPPTGLTLWRVGYPRHAAGAG